MASLKCRCGCGRDTTPWFAPSHDANANSILLKVQPGQLPREDIDRLLIDFVLHEGEQWWRDSYESLVLKAQKDRH